MSSTADLVTESTTDIPKKQEDEGKTFKTMTMGERVSYIKEYVTIEPLIAAYLMASVICSPALQNLELEKACKSNLELNDTVCDTILSGENHNYTNENNQMQKLISKMHSWQQPVQSIMPLILVLFLGSFSDRHKLRKPFLLVPIFGEFFAVAACILCVIFMRQWPLEALGVSQTIVPSIFGGPSMIIMAVFAYIADVSSLEMRTLRVGVVQIVLNVCQPICQSFSGILFVEIGYIAILCIGGGLYFFALCYGYFCIKEPKKPASVEKKALVADMFDPKHALETCNLLIKKSPGNNRLFIVLILFMLFIYNVVVIGEGSLFFLYMQGTFQWTIVEFSYLLTINTIVHLIGTTLGVSLFTKVWQLHDLVILAFSFFDKILANIFIVLAKTVAMIYAGIVVSIITGMTSVAIRSLATKIVSENDFGKAQSLFGICEAIGQAAAVSFYNGVIYVDTLETFPSAFFFCGIILYSVAICIIIFMYFMDKKKSQKVQKNTTAEKPVLMEDIVTHM